MRWRLTAKARAAGLLFLAACGACALSPAGAEAADRAVDVLPGGRYRLRSPDGRVACTVETVGGLAWSVEVDGRAVLVKSPLGVEVPDGYRLGGDVRVAKHRQRSADAKWRPVHGKNSEVRDRYNELVLQLVVAAGEKARGIGRFDLLARAYDDGVALRYFFPAHEGARELELREDRTHFLFAADHDAWLTEQGSYQGPQEKEFPRRRLGTVPSTAILGVPAVVKVAEDLYAAIAESALVDWAGMHLTGATGDGKLLFETGVKKGGEAADDISVPIAGVGTLLLEVDDADDFICDHADWAGARVVAKDGTARYLSDMTPASATQGWGQLRADRSVETNPMRIGERTFEKGLGTHSKGRLVYALDREYDRFEASVGIDAEVGARGSVVFRVRRLDGEAVGLVVSLARHGGGGVVKVDLPHASPWRILMIGRRPGDLVESELVLNLAEPCALDDTSWIRSGMMAWDHWWSVGSRMTTDAQKEYIQLAADMGWPYQLVDWTWYGEPGKSDPTTVIPAVDMPELLRFARERGVRLWLWMRWDDCERLYKEAFPLYERWGVAGVKIDFMDRDDQWMVNWYRKIVEAAAKHRLMVNFHGAYKPSGLRRTLPNLLTREGVLGNEYNGWSARITPEHKATLPFTRGLVGPMDFTPGGFVNRPARGFQPGRPTRVQGTRAGELALFVVYDSPLACVCDQPAHYRGQPGADFLKVVRTSWDETRVLAGEVSDYIVTARRSGDEWFLGAITDDTPRELDVKLDFLARGRYAVRIWKDAPDSGENPERIVTEERAARPGDTLRIALASGGGFVAHVRPAGR